MTPKWCPEGFVVAAAKTRRQRRAALPGDPLPVEGTTNAPASPAACVPRKTKKKDDLGVDPDTLLEAVLRHEATYAFAEVVVLPDPSRGGRPRSYPLWVWFVLNAYVDACGSVRQAFTNLQSEQRWSTVRTIAAEMIGVSPNEVLPERAPDRSWFHKTRKRHIVGHLDALRLALSEQGVGAARDMGLLDPDKPFDLKDRTRYVIADGKVIAARTQAAPGSTLPVEVVNPETGEVLMMKRPVRSEPDAKLHTTGDKRVVNGVKLWHADVHGPETHRHAIIAIDHVGDVKGGRNAENHVMMRNFRVLARLAPGVIGAITDGVSRGQELEEMQRDFGWLPIAPVAAGKRNEKTGELLEEKNGPLSVIEVPGCDAGPVELWYYEGRVVKHLPVDDGRLVLGELVWKGTRSRKNKDGTFRRYVDYEVVCNCGQHQMVHSERTISNDKDTERKLTRAENVRAVPPGSKLFEDLSPLRSAIEGTNSRIDDHLPLRRARSYGAANILLDLLGHAQWVNAYGRFLYGPGGTRRHEVADLAERAAA